MDSQMGAASAPKLLANSSMLDSRLYFSEEMISTMARVARTEKPMGDEDEVKDSDLWKPCSSSERAVTHTHTAAHCR